jgi:hypothetical protein
VAGQPPAASRPVAGRILLINQPELFSQPAIEAAAQSMAWPAGRALEITRIHPGNTRGAREAESQPAWYEVRAGGYTGWLPAAWLAPLPQPSIRWRGPALDIEVDATHGAAPRLRYRPTWWPWGLDMMSGIDYRLRRPAAAALAAMIAAAGRDGIHPKLFRPIALGKNNRHSMNNASGRTGPDHRCHARHTANINLGLAVDLTDGDQVHLLRESFGQTPAGRWLNEKAWIYGFAVSYTRANQPRTGIAPRPWHYRYWGIAQARTRHLAAQAGSPRSHKGRRFCWCRAPYF